MATDFEGLIPQGVARDLIAAAELESVAMRLGNVQRMPDGVESIPVVSVEPDAEWVDPKYTGRKKATTIEWTASRLEAEQLAAESLAEWERRGGPNEDRGEQPWWVLAIAIAVFVLTPIGVLALLGLAVWLVLALT